MPAAKCSRLRDETMHKLFNPTNDNHRYCAYTKSYILDACLFNFLCM